MRTGLAIACAGDSAEAGRRAARRALEQLGATPSLGIVFVSARLDGDAVRKGLEEHLAGVPLFGTSTHRELANQGLANEAVVLLLLADPDLEHRFVVLPRTADPAILAAALEGRLGPAPAGRERAGLMVGGELDPYGTSYLRALDAALGEPLLVSGGGACGHVDFGGEAGHAWAWAGDRVVRDELALLVLEAPTSEDGATFGFAYDSGASPVAPPVTCTRAEGNLVLELGGEPIATYLERYLGADFQDLLEESAFKYTFHWRSEVAGQEHHLFRTPRWAGEDGGIRFFPGDDVEGEELQLVLASRADLLAGVEGAAQRARDALGRRPPGVAIATSCLLRHRFLHTRAVEEARRVEAALGAGVPIAGFYATGEYAPLVSAPGEARAPGGGSRQLSTSLSLLVIAGDEEAAGDRAAELAAWLAEDARDQDTARVTRQRTVELEARLEAAESLIDNTEEAFRRVNQTLFRANLRNQSLQRVLRQYTPHAVWRKAHQSADRGEYTIPDAELELAFMFLDVKGFTAYSERHGAAEVIRELNRIFSPATEIIYDRRGDIDKFIGDCIFATFPGFPEAVGAACEIHEALLDILDADAPFSVRVGIHGGRVVAGNVGGELRRDNTLIGDAVNFTQRLESACTPGCVLVSAEAYAATKDQLPAAWTSTPRRIRVKGKADEYEVFELAPPP
jgi:class 3 adenylate cyclase